MKSLFIVLTVAATLLIVACAPATAVTPAAPTPTPTTSMLDAAKNEGKITVYTSLNADEFVVLVTEFNNKYPEIKVSFWRGTSDDVGAKAISEFRANNFAVDVLDAEDVDMIRLLNAGVLGRYKSPELSVYPADSYDPDGFYATDRLLLVVMGYNTNLVKKELAPKTWDDLLDPKWAGRMGVERGDFQLIAYSTLAWGETKAQNFWKRLGAQNPRVIKGHTELANALAAGEIAVSPTVFAHRIQTLKDEKNAPVDWVRSDPVFEFPTMIAIAKNTRNPNAARVWIDWVLSEAGQQAYTNLGRIPLRPGVKTKPASLLLGLNIYYGDPKILTKSNELQTQYRTLFGVKD